MAGAAATRTVIEYELGLDTFTVLQANINGNYNI